MAKLFNMNKAEIMIVQDLTYGSTWQDQIQGQEWG